MFHNVPVVWQYAILAGMALALTVIGLWLYNRREKRRKHAISVSVWSGVGAALPWIFALLLILLSLNSGYHDNPYGTPATFIPMGSPAPA